MHLRTALLLAVATACACATPPRPTEASLRLPKNARALLEGRVVDRGGVPIPGIRVEALPRGRDIPWSEPATTDDGGRFRLTVFAPAEYGFVLTFGGRTIVTPEKDDPARLSVAVLPGDRRTEIELIFLREEWERIR